MLGESLLKLLQIDTRPLTDAQLKEVLEKNILNIINLYADVITRLSRKYSFNGRIEVEDLMSEGRVGIIEGIHRYKPADSQITTDDELQNEIRRFNSLIIMNIIGRMFAFSYSNFNRVKVAIYILRVASYVEVIRQILDSNGREASDAHIIKLLHDGLQDDILSKQIDPVVAKINIIAHHSKQSSIKLVNKALQIPFFSTYITQQPDTSINRASLRLRLLEARDLANLSSKEKVIFDSFLSNGSYAGAANELGIRRQYVKIVINKIKHRMGLLDE